MNKTKIEWCDYTWNPVTGCLHGCKYCYARTQTKRFGGYEIDTGGLESIAPIEGKRENLFTLDRPLNRYISHSGKTTVAPYPFYFEPTFRHYRLSEPQQVKKPSKIFVVSMGDLFGEWVPDEWINQVMKAISKAPWHTYMMLTKNPERYWDYFEGAFQEIPEDVDFDGAKILLGTSITNQTDADKMQEWNLPYVDFLSIEPLLGDIDIEHILHDENEFSKRHMDWVIVGAQTGPGAVKPKPEWVQGIIDQCQEAGVPLFLKDNLNWPEKIQQFPEGMC